MLDLLKKIGVPATVAAVIATLVTVVPLLFTVDERYAKREEFKQWALHIQEENDNLKRELAQAVGFQQAMVELIRAGKLPTNFSFSEDQDARVVQVNLIESIKEAIAQRRAKEQEQAIKEIASKVVKAPESPASAAPAPEKVLEKAPIVIEKPRNWKELNEGLMRQEQRLILPIEKK